MVNAETAKVLSSLIKKFPKGITIVINSSGGIDYDRSFKVSDSYCEYSPFVKKLKIFKSKTSLLLGLFNVPPKLTFHGYAIYAGESPSCEYTWVSLSLNERLRDKLKYLMREENIDSEEMYYITKEIDKEKLIKELEK